MSNNYCRLHNICWTHEPQVCPDCNGSRTYTELVDDGDDCWDEMERTCSTCWGSGHVHSLPDGKY